MDIRTSDPRNGSRDQDNVKASKNNRRDLGESDNERPEDDTTSDDGRGGKVHGFAAYRKAKEQRDGSAQQAADLAHEYA